MLKAKPRMAIKKDGRRLITGWRQQVQASPSPSSRKRSAAAAKPTVKTAATKEPLPKEQWETEGGKVVKPVA